MQTEVRHSETVEVIFNSWGRPTMSRAFGYAYEGKVRRVWGIGKRKGDRFFHLVLGGINEPVLAEAEESLLPVVPAREKVEFGFVERLDDDGDF